MAGVLGRLHEFDAMLELWEQYVERLGHFLDAKGITNIDKKCSVLLSAIGPALYKLLTSLLSPQKPGEKTYKELVTLLTKHYNPAPLENVERYKFHMRMRHEGETVSTFVAELRSLAWYCKFCTSLNDLLRDGIVCGINDENINAHSGFSIGYRGWNGECKEERDRATDSCTKTDRCIQSYYHELLPLWK